MSNGQFHSESLLELKKSKLLASIDRQNFASNDGSHRSNAQNNTQHAQGSGWEFRINLYKYNYLLRFNIQCTVYCILSMSLETWTRIPNSSIYHISSIRSAEPYSMAFVLNSANKLALCEKG